MSRRLLLAFEHTTCDVSVDINIRRPDPIVKSAEAMAARVCPSCPICTEPMRYTGWSFDDDEDGVPLSTIIPPRGHMPLLTLDATTILGCTCGWRLPPGTTSDADRVLAMHCAGAERTDDADEKKGQIR